MRSELFVTFDRVTTNQYLIKFQIHFDIMSVDCRTIQRGRMKGICKLWAQKM